MLSKNLLSPGTVHGRHFAPCFTQRTILQGWKPRLRGLRPCYSKPGSRIGAGKTGSISGPAQISRIRLCSHKIPGDGDRSVRGARSRDLPRATWLEDDAGVKLGSV